MQKLPVAPYIPAHQLPNSLQASFQRSTVATITSVTSLLRRTLLRAEPNDVRNETGKPSQSVLQEEGAQRKKWPYRLQMLTGWPQRSIQVQNPDLKCSMKMVPRLACIPDDYAFICPLLDGFFQVGHVAGLLFMVYFVWTLDCQAGLSLSLLGNVITLGMVTLVSLPCLIARQWRRMAGIITAFGLALFIFSCYDQTADKALYRLRAQIPPGTTLAQVEHLAQQAFPAHGRFGTSYWHCSSDPRVRTLIIGGELVIFLTPEKRVVSTFVQD